MYIKSMDKEWFLNVCVWGGGGSTAPIFHRVNVTKNIKILQFKFKIL